MSKLNWRNFEETVVEKGLKLFSPRDVSLFFDVSQRAAQGFLSYNVKGGFIIKLKRGVYALKKNFPPDFLIANKLYEPSYVSLSTALSFHQLIPETVYSITSVTPKPTREIEVLGRTFSYSRIKKEAFTGYEPREVFGETVLMATPEKAVVDFLYFVSLGKRSYNDRLKIEQVDGGKLWGMAESFKNQRLLQSVEEILEGRNA